MVLCPECQSPMSKFAVGEWTELICLNCGHYESNSPAYRDNPKLFENLVRDDPIHFLRKFLKIKIVPYDESKRPHKSDDKVTEPFLVMLNSCC